MCVCEVYHGAVCVCVRCITVQYVYVWGVARCSMCVGRGVSRCSMCGVYHGAVCVWGGGYHGTVQMCVYAYI